HRQRHTGFENSCPAPILIPSLLRRTPSPRQRATIEARNSRYLDSRNFDAWPMGTYPRATGAPEEIIRRSWFGLVYRIESRRCLPDLLERLSARRLSRPS